MKLDPKLLPILTCPDCRGDIQVLSKEKEEKLKCVMCGRVFEVKNGTPSMLPKDQL